MARALLALLIEIASRDPALEQIHLAVTSAQPAAGRLYRSAGFETYGVERRGLKVGETYLDHDQMALRLGPKT